MYGLMHYLIKFQAISIGCLFSIFAFEKKIDGQWLMKFKLPVNLVALFLIFYLNCDSFYTIHAVFVNLVISLITGYIIASNIIPAKDVVFRFLNLKVYVIYRYTILQHLYVARNIYFERCEIALVYGQLSLII